MRRFASRKARLTGVLLAQAAVVGIGASVARATNYSTLLGAANIDAAYYLNPNENVMNDAQSQLDLLGSHTEKLELDQYDLVNTWSSNTSKYAWNSNWPALNSSTTLVTIASMPSFVQAFSDPDITSYDITTYSPNIPGGGDGTSYWANGMTSQQITAETNSFYNLTKYLMETYNGTGKSFYLSNWEGDGALVDAMPKGDVVPPPTEVNGMIAWLNARQAGIDEARDQLASEYPDVHVYGTVEVNHVEAAMEGDVYDGQSGFATVTNDVLPYTTTDFVSYSSYDTQQNTSGTYSYANAVQYVAEHLPSTAINGQNTHSEYVGEFGLAENYSGAATVNTMMNNVINTAVADGMPMAFYWEVYSNELIDGVTTPPGGDGDDSTVQGFYLVKPDGTPATAWKTYAYLITANNSAEATSGAIERNLHLAYASNFTAPNATLSSAWSTNTDGGAMSVGLSGGQLQMTTVNSASTPVGQATLNIDSVLGRGLAVGEYIQFTLNRENDAGIIGTTALGINHGSATGSGSQPLEIYPDSTYGWIPLSYNGSNNTNPTYSWDTPGTTLGLRLTGANGFDATIAYYVNGTYSGSWLYQTSSTTLTSFSLFAQSSTANAGFAFNNVAIYTTNGSLAGTNYLWDPAQNGSASGGSGTWDSGTTADMFNGTSDVTWNYSTLADQVTFGGTAGTVTVATAGVTASTINFNVPNYVLTGGPITMLGNQTINASNGAVTINNVITGTNGLTVIGSGNVTLGGANTFSNGLYVNGGGTVNFSMDDNLGAAGQGVNLSNGTLDYTGTTTPTETRIFTIGSGGGTIDLVNNASTGKLIINGTNLITGSGNLTKSGPGWLTLYGTNSTFTGNWTINGGVVESGGSDVLGSGSVTINNGGELANNNPTAISNAITINTGGTLSADSTATTTGTYTGPVTAAGNFTVRLGNFWSGISQNVTLNGNLNGSGSMTIGFASGETSTTGVLTLGGNNSGYSGNIIIPGGTVTPAVSSNIELGTGPVTLSGGNLALAGQGAPTNQSYDNNVNVTANSGISVSGALNAYMANLNISTATLAVSSADTSGNPYSLNFLSTTQGGSPTFNIANSAGGGHGTLYLYDGGGYPVSVGFGNASSGSPTPHVYQTFSVTSGTVAFPAHQSGQSPVLTIVSSLSLSGTGTVDLANNDMIVTNSNLAAVTSLVKDGYNNGNWNGSGIISSSAAANSAHLTALGVLLNSTASGSPIYTNFEGQAVNATDVLVKYTYYGDADLSGTVDASDYSRIDNGYLNHLTGWQNGDFNYDGVVNGSDYTLIDNAYNTQGANIASAIASVTANYTDQIAGASSVPEPATLSTLGMVMLGLLTRRRQMRQTAP